MTDYPLWHCHNPHCYSLVRAGRPRVLFSGALGPGSEVPRKCPECGGETLFCVDVNGRIECVYRPFVGGTVTVAGR